MREEERTTGRIATFFLPVGFPSLCCSDPLSFLFVVTSTLLLYRVLFILSYCCLPPVFAVHTTTLQGPHLLLRPLLSLHYNSEQNKKILSWLSALSIYNIPSFLHSFNADCTHVLSRNNFRIFLKFFLLIYYMMSRQCIVS
mgnify:CR=1 FL=1